MAIVNGRSGTFNIYTENQYISGYVAWQETYDDSTYISTNKSTVTIKAYLHRTNIYSGETYLLGTPMTRIAYFGSEEVKDKSSVSLSIAGNSSSSGGAYTKVYEASKEITHDSDGGKSLDIGFYMTNNVSGVAGNSFRVAKTMSNETLTTIPRYATSNQSLNSKTETTITMNWSSDNIIDGIWYSVDNGANWNWVHDPRATSGSYTIKGLSANTTYNIKTRVKRLDNQLSTDSSNLSVTTYDYPYCTSAPNFTIGNNVTIQFYNPLNRTIQIQMWSHSSQAFVSDLITTSGTSYTGFSNISDRLYASIPNNTDSGFNIDVHYDGNKNVFSGGKYSIKGTEAPTVGSITYADTNTTVTAITGNNQHIVQNQSNLKITYTKATAKNSASISKYTFVLNGVTKTSTSAGGTVDFGKINSASNLTLTMTVTDSRGLTSSATKTITMLAHSNPTAIVTLNRLNNYEDESYLTVDSSISSVNSKNTMAIKYRYKVSGGSYGSYTTISDNVKQTLTLDKNNAYIFNVVITDAFGSTYNKEHVLEKGVFPLFIDTEKNSVGINCFPKEEKSFEVNGDCLIPKQLYLTFNNDYVYSTDLEYICFKIGKIVILNIRTIAFKTALSHESVILRGLPIPKNYSIFYLYGGQNSLGATASVRCAVNTYGDVAAHYSGTDLVGESANKQFSGIVIYETTD